MERLRNSCREPDSTVDASLILRADVLEIISGAPHLLEHQRVELISALEKLPETNPSGIDFLGDLEDSLGIDNPSEDSISEEELIIARQAAILKKVEETITEKERLNTEVGDLEGDQIDLDDVVAAVLSGLLGWTYEQLTPQEQFRIRYELKRYHINGFDERPISPSY